jgi:hypothetical protein
MTSGNGCRAFASRRAKQLIAGTGQPARELKRGTRRRLIHRVSASVPSASPGALTEGLITTDLKDYSGLVTGGMVSGATLTAGLQSTTLA